MTKRNVYVIAGPNGSGKTTFARLFLPDYVNCPNVDSWMLFDNSQAKPVLIAKKKNGHMEMINESLFKIIQKGVE